MPIAQDVRRITEDIEVSYGERVAFLSNLFEETDNTLKTFHRNHQKMATDLGDFLTSDKDNREELVKELREENKEELVAMAEKLANFLKESKSAMEKNTAKLMIQIREDISSMEKEIASLCLKFNKERQSMGKEMKEELVSTTRRRIEEVKKMLAAFSAAHEVRSQELRHQLSSFQKELKKGVEEMRGMITSDLKGARENWQNLAKIMASKRTGKRVPITVVPKEAEVPKRVEEAAEEAFSKGELKIKALALIEESSKGISLRQLGGELRIAYIRLGKPIRELVNEGKVVKKDSLYFPA